MTVKVFWGLLAGLAVAVLSSGAWAAEPKKADSPPEPGFGGPEVMFNRMDKNHDGAIAPDEIPPGAPERVKEYLKKADKNADKKLTLDELKEAWKAGPPGMPWAGRGMPGRGPQAGPKPPEQASSGPKRPHGPGADPFRIPDPKALFASMDKNHDGSLSLDEFVAGMAESHKGLPKPGPGALGGRPPQPGPGGPHGMGPGAGFGGFPGGGFHGPMGGPGAGHMPPAFCPCPWCRMGPPPQAPQPWQGPHPWGGGPAAGHAVPPWHAAGPGSGAEGWGKGPGPRPEQRPPFAQAGGPGEDHLRKLVAKLVREELDKIAKEKAGTGHAKPELKK